MQMHAVNAHVVNDCRNSTLAINKYSYNNFNFEMQSYAYVGFKGERQKVLSRLSISSSKRKWQDTSIIYSTNLKCIFCQCSKFFFPLLYDVFLISE